jgi:predicted ribosome quality control (RQC) complex YloA/Tae2 family protein
MSHELSTTLVGMRLQNIYDLSSRIFLFKFQKPDHREQLVVDTGFRCHLTSFARTTAAEPSVFVKRLRKILGTRRVTSVTQIGTDRIIEFQFSEGQYRLFLEFYAGGNLVVTDKDLNILALFRNVNDGAEHEHVKIGVSYNLTLRQNYNGVPDLTIDRTRNGLQTVIDQNKANEQPELSAKKKKKGSELKRALTQTFREWPPMLVDHVLLLHDFDVSTKLEDVIANPDLLDKLFNCMRDAQTIQKGIIDGSNTKGYIIAKKRKDKTIETRDKSMERENLLYDDFQPFKPKQFEQDSDLVCLEFDGFNKTVDEFYSSIEGQKLDSKLQEREANAKKKLEDTKRQHQERLGSLKQAQTLNIRKAEAIEANVERIQEATEAVNGLIAQSMDWADIARLIEAEQRRGNPVAQLIKLPLKLYENTVTLLLAEPSTEEEESNDNSETESSSSDSDDGGRAGPARQQQASTPTGPNRLEIDIDLSLSPWANASQYYDQKRTAAVKEVKTAQISDQALKNAERKIAADLKKGLSQEKDILRPIRRTFWFEKFFYFISSDGYLVVGAKDALQSEVIYNKYLKKGDVFVHADITGASVVIIKNNPSTPDAPIPPATLSQAGTLSIASSIAWDSKALLPAFWVKSEQVSKTSPHGDYLSPGSFHIDGEKTFLPPAQLLVGIGIVFQISEESKANHTKHRFAVDPISEDNTLDMKEESTNRQPAAQAEDQKETAANPIDEDSDDSEDFPDATPVIKYDSDDEDFPDVELNTRQDSGDEDDEPKLANPLQSSTLPRSEITVPEPSPVQDEPGLQAVDDEDDSISVAATDTTTTENSGRRHLSAKERRLLTKGIKPDTTSRSETPTLLDDDASDTQSITTTTASKTISAALPRGKRSKQKKVAAKYANQDEEDRSAALARLGSQAGAARKEAEAVSRREKEVAEQAAKQRRREQHLRVQAVGRAAEQSRKAAMGGDGSGSATAGGGEGVDVDDAVDDEVAQKDLLSLDVLVGKPLPGDEIVAAIPVCAPWTALANYKFRAKMQPGTLKKGKAAREVFNKWQLDSKNVRNLDQTATDTDRIWPREAELLAGIKDTEVIAVMPVSKVRVMMAGGKDGGGSGSGKGKSGGKGTGGKGKKKA